MNICSSSRVRFPDIEGRIKVQFLSKIFGGGGSSTTTSTQQNPWSQAVPLLEWYSMKNAPGQSTAQSYNPLNALYGGYRQTTNQPAASKFSGLPTIGGIAKEVQPYGGSWGSDYGLSAPQIRNPVLQAMQGNQGTGNLIRQGAGAGGMQSMAAGLFGSGGDPNLQQLAGQRTANPYLMSALNRAAEATRSSIGGALNRSGRFGGAYHTRAAGDAVGDIYRRGLTEAYESNQNRRLAAAQSAQQGRLGALGALGQGLGLDASTRLGALQSRTQDKRLGLQASTVAQFAQQQAMDKQRQQHDAGQYADIEANQRFLNAILGLSGQGGTATQTARTSESANPLGTIASIASALGGFF